MFQGKTVFETAGLIVCIISVCLLFGSGHASGQTYINSDINTDTLWNPDGSPYIIQKNIAVRRYYYDTDNRSYCPTLTISSRMDNGTQGDVEIKFVGGAKLTVGANTVSENWYGALNAQGTAEHPIKFTRANTEYWGGISFGRATKSGETILENCILEYGGNGLSGIIYFYRSSQIIKNCTISHSYKHGINIYRSSPVIDNCTIENSAEDGIQIDGQMGATAGTIKNSTIIDNEVHGIRIRSSGACSIKIKNNEISNNSAYGIYCDGIGNKNDPEISKNIFMRNGPYPIRVPAFVRIAQDNNFISNNSTIGIELIGSDINEFSLPPGEDTVIWYNFGLPYIVKENNIDVGSEGATYKLIIYPGTTIKFDAVCGLYIGAGSIYDKGPAKFTAEGTKESPITFTTSQPGQYWKGLQLKWSQTIFASRLNHCIIEYGGNEKNLSNLNAGLCFWICTPSEQIVKNSTIRYSMSDGIRLYNATGDGEIHNCNIYGNGLYDIIVHNNSKNVNASLNYWGTPNGPSLDMCSSAVVGDTVTYEAWLEEEFTEPFRIITAKADPALFNPLIEQTTISFTLSEHSDWTLDILNSQFEKVWSISGNGSGDSISWNGVGDYGIVSGKCYYRISAQSASGIASPALGFLNLGNKTVAGISNPSPHSLFASGASISIVGTAATGAVGYYEVLYGFGANPALWFTISGKVYSSRENEVLSVWDTTGIDQPDCTIRLDVHVQGVTYSDLTSLDFIVEKPLPQQGTAVIHTYDRLGRLSGVSYPDNSSIQYIYDKVGNRLSAISHGESPPTVIELLSFTVRPTMRGIVVQWQTASETDTAGFNLYRKSSAKTD